MIFRLRPDFVRRLPLVVILVAAALGAFTLRNVVTFDALKAHRDVLMAFCAAHYTLSVLIFLLAYIAIVAFSLPGATIATLTGGFLFNLFPGVIFNVTGATIGATLLFIAARAGLGDRLAARFDASEGAAKRLHDGIRDNELSFLFVMRLVPAVPFFVANIIPALVGVSLRRFVVTTFLGIIPGAMVYTWVGAGLDMVIENGGMPDMGIIFRPVVLIPLLILAALALMPVVIKALQRRRGRG
jgi:uncharacterized membrane protein YdjX (TVP38/TMEM64 family)